MIAVVPLLALAAAAAQPPTPTERALVALEKQSWVAWQKMDAVFWNRFLSADHVEVNGFVGSIGKADVVRGVASKSCKVNSYKVDNFRFTQIDPRTAVLVYRAEQDTTCGSVKVPSPVWATSLYQKRQGRWENVLYGHTPVMEPPKRN